MSQRETLDCTLIVVTDSEGNETEVDPDEMLGDLDIEASQSIIIGRAVRSALMATDSDGDTVTVRIFYQ